MMSVPVLSVSDIFFLEFQYGSSLQLEYILYLNSLRQLLAKVITHNKYFKKIIDISIYELISVSFFPEELKLAKTRFDDLGIKTNV